MLTKRGQKGNFKIKIIYNWVLYAWWTSMFLKFFSAYMHLHFFWNFYYIISKRNIWKRDKHVEVHLLLIDEYSFSFLSWTFTVIVFFNLWWYAKFCSNSRFFRFNHGLCILYLVWWYLMWGTLHWFLFFDNCADGFYFYRLKKLSLKLNIYNL